MDQDHIERDWPRLQSFAHREWEFLTADDLAEVEDNRQKLIAMIEQKYGIPHEEAKRQVEEWAGRL